jgi:hypothetical protein
MPWLGFVSVAVLLTARAAPTEVGQPAPVVVVARSGDAQARLVRRIEAELSASGFDVVEVERAHGAEEPSELFALARSNEAVAAVSLVEGARDLVAVWLVDRVTGKTSMREVAPGGAEDPDEVVAVRVVELLQASLLETVAPHPSRGEVEPPDVVAALVEPVRSVRPAMVAPRAWVGAGPWVAGTPGGIGVVGGAAVEGGTAFGRRRIFGVGAGLHGSFLRSRIATEPGTVVVGLGIARVHAYAWPMPARRVSPGFGLGVGLLLAWAHGEPTGPTPGRVTATVAALPSAAGDLAVRLTDTLRLRLGIRIGIALPELVVAVQGQRAATGGRPWTDGVIALEWTPTRR